MFLSDLSGPALSQGLEATIQTLERVIEERKPAIIAIDSLTGLPTPVEEARSPRRRGRAREWES